MNINLTLNNNFLTKLFEKASKLANHKHAVTILAIISVAESSFFPIPIPPDFFLIAMSIANPNKAIKYAFVCIICTLLGSILGYSLGFLAYDLFVKKMLIYFNYMDLFLKYQNYYQEYNILALLIGGFAPIPYKIITLATGVLQTNIFLFLAITLISKGIKFTLLALVSRYLKNLNKPIIIKLIKYSFWIFIIILISVIIGFVIYYI